MNEEIKSILIKLNEVSVDENLEKLTEVIQSILYLLDDEITERRNLESKIERIRQRVDEIE